MDGPQSPADTLAALRRHLENLQAASYPAATPPQASRLQETAEFGRNPGKLRMLQYVPDGIGPAPALVVVLHGCTQSAASHDEGSGWSTLAERHGFALLMPEQQSANNPNLCFNWFEPAHTRRGGGEAMSISQMVKGMIETYGIDPARVFITGLSAGGAMTAAVLAAYPEMFAAGAVIAGVPVGAAGNVREALEAMRRGPQKSPSEWGDVVRRASPHEGRWPRLSVWHGDSDPVVHPQNAENLLEQWQDLHGLTVAPDSVERAAAHRRRVWRDKDGREALESYVVSGMAHGVPLGFDKDEDRCGRAGPLHFDVGISSAASIVRFFGIESDTPSRAASAGPAANPFAAAFPGDPRAAIAAALRQAGLLDAAAPDPRAAVAKALHALGLFKK